MKTMLRIIGLTCAFTLSAGSADYSPLAKGNTWTYRLSNGMEMVLRATGNEDLGGVRCTVVETTVDTPQGRITSSESLVSDATGIRCHKMVMGGQPMPVEPPLVRLRLPFRAGDTWTCAQNLAGYQIQTTFVAAGRETITVPAGRFECLKVRSTAEVGGQRTDGEMWYADGVGMVKTTIRTGGQETVIELAGCRLQSVPPPPPVRTVTPAATTVHPAATPAVCPACGAPTSPGARFCEQCGAKLQAATVTPAPVPDRRPAPAADQLVRDPQGRYCIRLPAGWKPEFVDDGFDAEGREARMSLRLLPLIMSLDTKLGDVMDEFSGMLTEVTTETERSARIAGNSASTGWLRGTADNSLRRGMQFDVVNAMPGVEGKPGLLFIFDMDERMLDANKPLIRQIEQSFRVGVNQPAPPLTSGPGPGPAPRPVTTPAPAPPAPKPAPGDQATPRALLEKAHRAATRTDYALAAQCFEPDLQAWVSRAFAATADVRRKMGDLWYYLETKLEPDDAQMFQRTMDSFSLPSPLAAALDGGAVRWDRVQIQEQGDTATVQIQGRGGAFNLKRVNGQWYAVTAGERPAIRAQLEQMERQAKRQYETLADLELRIENGSVPPAHYAEELGKALNP